MFARYEGYGSMDAAPRRKTKSFFTDLNLGPTAEDWADARRITLYVAGFLGSFGLVLALTLAATSDAPMVDTAGAAATVAIATTEPVKPTETVSETEKIEPMRMKTVKKTVKTMKTARPVKEEIVEQPVETPKSWGVLLSLNSPDTQSAAFIYQWESANPTATIQEAARHVATGATITQLVAFAKTTVPAEEVANTKLYLFASPAALEAHSTAATQQQQHLDGLRTQLLKSGFSFSWNDASVLSANNEAIYMWLAANRVTSQPAWKSLLTATQSVLAVVSAAEETTQVAANTAPISQTGANSFSVMPPLVPHAMKVTVNANAALGVTEVLQGLIKNEIDSIPSGSPVSVSLTNPCLPVGYTYTSNAAQQGSTIQIIGSSNINDCAKRIASFVSAKEFVFPQIPNQVDTVLSTGFSGLLGLISGKIATLKETSKTTMAGRMIRGSAAAATFRNVQTTLTRPQSHVVTTDAMHLMSQQSLSAKNVWDIAWNVCMSDYDSLVTVFEEVVSLDAIPEMCTMLTLTSLSLDNQATLVSPVYSTVAEHAGGAPMRRVTSLDWSLGAMLSLV